MAFFKSGLEGESKTKKRLEAERKSRQLDQFKSG